MKYAAAMRYGGELVDALECDYSAFKQLVPLCPNCKEPVYLRSGGERVHPKDENKTVLVRPHWCHFKGISQEQVASCESRVNGYSEKDKQRIAAKARGQRLKLLQRWFWNVVLNSATDLSRSSDNQFLMSLSGNILETEDILKDKYYFIRPDYFFDAYQSWFKKTIQEGLGGGYIWDLIKISKIYIEEFCPRIAKDFHNQKISFEVLGFLASNSSRHVYRLLDECIPPALHSTAKAYGFETDEEGYELISSESLQGLCFFIFSIPWASEFQRLEVEAKKQSQSI